MEPGRSWGFYKDPDIVGTRWAFSSWMEWPETERIQVVVENKSLMNE